MLIGVTTSARKGTLMWWCTKLGLKLCGAHAIRLTAFQQERFKECDGYIISGGVDINPKLYHQTNIASVDIEDERDTLEHMVIEHALAKKKPLMGICRGSQMINVVKGGTLHQNARDFYDGFVPTDSVIGKIFSRRKINIYEDGILCSLFRNDPHLYVNSLHHQAIHTLGEGLKIVAKDALGIVQAIESENLDKQFIIGMQWHPEFMLHTTSNRKIFRRLVQACKH